MSKFLNTFLDTEMREDQTRTLYFFGKEPLVDIVKELSTSCGCSKARLIKDKNAVAVDFKAGSIPVHLRLQGWYETTKEILITYNDKTSEVLKFKARVRA